ncbi:hypothetical protein SO802_023840 [Lithocarpus litseifolius]|uniref:Uncharacterized protein n=1 Tax=Lithocarpus litseifolius TaxID=425828 RepID=A0AAW2C7R5_9ROSI
MVAQSRDTRWLCFGPKDSDESCDGERNYSTFMTIDHVASSDDLSVLVEELREHSELESIGIIEESDDEEDEGIVGLQEAYNSLLEKTGEYAKVANVAIRKMKRAEENYRILLVRHKEAKCEIEKLNGELSEAYAKVRFLELEVVQANAKVEMVSTKKLDDVISSQKHFSEKSMLGYTGESSSAIKIAKEVKFVKVKEPVVAAPYLEKEENEKKKNVVEQRVMNKPRNHSLVKPEARRKSLPRSQRVIKGQEDQEVTRGQDGDTEMVDVMKMIGAFTTCLESFTKRFYPFDFFPYLKLPVLVDNPSTPDVPP